MFSRLVYCADCGGKMYLCRVNYFKSEQYYICSTYYKNRILPYANHTLSGVSSGTNRPQNMQGAVAYVI